MDLSPLGFDRNLYKSPTQNVDTKNTPFVSGNPQPQKTTNSSSQKPTSQNIGSDDGAINIITGTVITACLIQTSALPSRVEMAGNDITFFDDTYERNGEIVGDTSRLVFTHGSGRSGDTINQGFIMEKRASTHDTFDNVLAFYALPPKEEKMNYMFFGRGGQADRNPPNVNSIQFAINHSTGAVTQDSANGSFLIYGVNDADTVVANANLAIQHNEVFGLPGDGYSVLLTGTGVGGLYLGSIAQDLLPSVTATINLGSPSFKFDKVYGTAAACSLPTVEDAISLLEEIPEPSYIGDKGHFGPEKPYFYDQTFPDRLTFINSEGNKDIDLVTICGFLLKAVIELNAKVKLLESMQPE